MSSIWQSVDAQNERVVASELIYTERGWLVGWSLTSLYTERE